MNGDGSEQRNLTRSPGPDHAHAWSPDGRRIAFVSRRDGNNEVYVVNVDGSGLQNLTRNPANEGAPRWSRDGRRISFASAHNGNSEFYVINADGSGRRNLTRNPANDYLSSWLPDGRIASYRVVDERQPGNPELYVMNADGSGERNLTREWGLDHFSPLAWSPNGRKVAFVSPRVGCSGNCILDATLYLMNADGSGRRKVTDGLVPDSAPDWSAGGRTIAFTKSLGGWERGSFEVFVVNADGSGLRRLTRRPGNDHDPVWSPEPAN